MTTPKIILIHGNGGGTKTDHWFPYIKTELEKLGLTVIAETFPDNVDAHMNIWLPYIKELGADENTIIIGHSSGGVAALRYAEHNKILGSVLVGVNYTDLGYEEEKLSGYYDKPWDWEAIKNNQKFIIQFASTDDPFIPIEEPRFIHEKLNTEYHEFADKEHFGVNKEMLEFPELITAIKKAIIYFC